MHTARHSYAAAGDSGTPKQRGHLTSSTPRRSIASSAGALAFDHYYQQHNSSGAAEAAVAVVVVPHDQQPPEKGKERPPPRSANPLRSRRALVSILIAAVACAGVVVLALQVSGVLAALHNPLSMYVGQTWACDISYTLIDSTTRNDAAADLKVYKTYTSCRHVPTPIDYQRLRDDCMAACDPSPTLSVLAAANTSLASTPATLVAIPNTTGSSTSSPTTTTASSSSSGSSNGDSVLSTASSSTSSSGPQAAARRLARALRPGDPTCPDLCRAECDCKASSKSR